VCLFNVQSSQEEHELNLKFIKIAARNQKDEAKMARKGKPPRIVERRMRHIMAIEGHWKEKRLGRSNIFLQYPPCLFLF